MEVTFHGLNSDNLARCPVPLGGGFSFAGNWVLRRVVGTKRRPMNRVSASGSLQPAPEVSRKDGLSTPAGAVLMTARSVGRQT
jgi:hypothetical protein